MGCAGVGDGDRHWGENGGTVQFPRLSENKHDTAWFGGHEGRPEQEDVRRGGMDGLGCIWSLLHGGKFCLYLWG